MRPGIWECNENHIHIAYGDIEIEFEDMNDFLDAMEVWQEYALFHRLKFESMPEDFWLVFSEANRN